MRGSRHDTRVNLTEGVCRVKILVLAQSAGIGGVESSLAQFINYIVELGHEVTLVFWRESGPLMHSIPSNVTVIDIQRRLARWIYRTGGVKEALRLDGALRRLSALAAITVRHALRHYKNPWILLNPINTQFDVAIAYRHEGYGPYYLVDKVEAHKKVMWFHHGAYTPSPMGLRVDRSYFGQLDTIVAVSAWGRSVLGEAFPELLDRIIVIRNMIDIQAIRHSALKPVFDARKSPYLTLVTVSRLSEEKGIDIAIKAAHTLKEKGLAFVWYIVGDGPERSKLAGLIDSLELADDVVLLGERANPFPYMHLADIYVQTSRVEAYGLTIEEAKVLGKPVVASNIPSALEVLDDGRLGILCEPDATAFATAIASLAQDSEARETLKKRLALENQTNAPSQAAIDRLLSSQDD